MDFIVIGIVIVFFICPAVLWPSSAGCSKARRIPGHAHISAIIAAYFSAICSSPSQARQAG